MERIAQLKTLFKMTSFLNKLIYANDVITCDGIINSKPNFKKLMR